MKQLLENLTSLIPGNGRRNFSDVYMAVIIVCVISLLVVPVPEWMLDTFIAINLMISTILLMMSVYMSSVLSFSTFPSILLITTLFRLAINVTTTRMILTNASAGEIIFTFGNFVVGGNFIVGAVLFLILLIVQFIVITKGAERVAEVAARFTLDAMPGKQMSIDADMRANVIDIREAQRRRGILEKESQLFGAMDGAMKFVKGDAIASLIIVAINITAGICIGTMQKGMEVSTAVTTYSILTIGDGLVSQIPALLISITAGMITTRVGAEAGSGLGMDVFKQIFAFPKALMIGSGVLAGFALIPGFPKIQFLILAVALGALGIMLQRKIGKPNKFGGPSASGGAASEESSEIEEFSPTVAILVNVDQRLEQHISAAELNAEFTGARKALYTDLGVPFPNIHLRFSKGLEQGAYQVLLHEVPISEGIVQPNDLYVHEENERLQALGINSTPVTTPIDRRSANWVSKAALPQLQQLGISAMEPTKLLSYHISLVLKKYAREFIGLQETRSLLTKMEKEYGEVVREVQRVVSPQKIAEVLQRLVQEGISIRNLNNIFQALVEWGGKEKDPVLLVEYVRIALRRYISYRFSAGQNILAAYLIEPRTEETIRKAIRQTSSGSFLALEPAISRNIVSEIKRTIGKAISLEKPPVILTSMDIRRYTRKLLELDLPEVPVLSHQELTEEIQVQPLGSIKGV